MTLQYIRRVTSFEDLAYKWLRQDNIFMKGGCDPVLRKTVQNICFTWIAFFYAILKVRLILIVKFKCDFTLTLTLHSRSNHYGFLQNELTRLGRLRFKATSLIIQDIYLIAPTSILEIAL